MQKLYSMSEDDSGRLSVRYSLMITKELSFTMWCEEIKIALSKVSHICKEKFEKCSQVLNLLVFLKNMNESKAIPPTNTIEHVVSILKKIIPDIDDNLAKKVSFLEEQLELSIKSKKGRRYSSDLLACATEWENTSPALYTQCDQRTLFFQKSL